MRLGTTTPKRSRKPDNVLSVRTVGTGFTGQGVVVAVIDSGWDTGTRDNRILPGRGFVDAANDLRLQRTGDCTDRIGHGTICTNLLLDVAPNCRVLPLRVFGTRLETSPDVLLAAFEHAVHSSVKLINMSLGTLRVDVMRPLFAACETASRAGIIIVAAARGARNPMAFPAVFAPVIGVGAAALEDALEVAYMADAAIECGVRVREREGRGINGCTRIVSGTSYGVPIVTGLLAQFVEEFPDLDVNGARQLLQERTGCVRLRDP